jgi:hypothetical protein
MGVATEEVGSIVVDTLVFIYLVRPPRTVRHTPLRNYGGQIEFQRFEAVHFAYRSRGRFPSAKKCRKLNEIFRGGHCRLCYRQERRLVWLIVGPKQFFVTDV